jgi:hypothetical protein
MMSVNMFGNVPNYSRQYDAFSSIPDNSPWEKRDIYR